MRDIILDKLNEIEKEHQVRILYANESGSRAWGFPSPDSDYDVRFFYLRPKDFYLSVVERKDQLDFPINDELDIKGWDIRKALQLVCKSNTTPFEWLQSPIIYREVPGFRDAFWAHCQHYFGIRSNVHHYLGIASGALAALTDEGAIGIKKLFYVLRPLLSAKWCLEQRGIAPMTIEPLMGQLPADIHTRVTELIRLKADAAEGFMIQPEASLLAYIRAEFQQINEASGGLERAQFDTDRADTFFRRIIADYEH